MINFEHTQVFGWEAAIRGMRNPMNSWEKSDSEFCILGSPDYEESIAVDYDDESTTYIGPNDQNLMMRLVKAGDEHAKFMRMIHVQMDILAPLYWWKQADTYKVGFVTNSCSTMHKIQAKEFVLDDFSQEHLLDIDESSVLIYDDDDAEYPEDAFEMWTFAPLDILNVTIKGLNKYRDLYLQTKDKRYWWQMIQLLPDSYNQLRTCDTNYATLRKMYHQRKGHKLDEWNDFRAWAEELPYSELITTKE